MNACICVGGRVWSIHAAGLVAASVVVLQRLAAFGDFDWEWQSVRNCLCLASA